jgi:hypothetical protein
LDGQIHRQSAIGEALLLAIVAGTECHQGHKVQNNLFHTLTIYDLGAKLRNKLQNA